MKQDIGYHYLCPKCHNFPFIKFTESKKYIQFTCSCYTNKEILIKDLFDINNKYITINYLSNINTLSSISNNNDYDNMMDSYAKNIILLLNFTVKLAN